nr:hypothetical protein Q903MT_gene2672 [Picea sitchensis]
MDRTRAGHSVPKKQRRIQDCNPSLSEPDFGPGIKLFISRLPSESASGRDIINQRKYDYSLSFLFYRRE